MVLPKIDIIVAFLKGVHTCTNKTFIKTEKSSDLRLILEETKRIFQILVHIRGGLSNGPLNEFFPTHLNGSFDFNKFC